MAAHMAATLAMLALIAVSSALQVDNLPTSELGPFVIAGSALYKLYKTRPTGSSPSKVLKLESEQRVLREYSTFACNTWLPAIQRKIPLPADRNMAKQLDLDLAQGSKMMSILALGIATVESIGDLQVSLRYASELCADGQEGDIKFMASFPSAAERSAAFKEYGATPANKAALARLSEEAIAYENGAQKLSDNVGKWNATGNPKAGDHCGTAADCYSCAKRVGCGWCEVSSDANVADSSAMQSKCMPGSLMGASSADQCKVSSGVKTWKYAFCHAPPSGGCAAISNCTTCLQTPWCGFCVRNGVGQCMHGDSIGPLPSAEGVLRACPATNWRHMASTDSLVNLCSNVHRPPVCYKTVVHYEKRPGNTLSLVDLPRPDPQLCAHRCGSTPGCKAWTFQVVRMVNYCWLKSEVLPAVKYNAAGERYDASVSSGVSTPGGCFLGAERSEYIARNTSFANCQDFVNWNINRTSGSQIAQTSLDVAEPQHCQAQCDDMPKCRTWLYSELTAAVRKDMHPNNVGSYPTHKAVCRFFNGTGGRGGPCVNATCASGSSLGGPGRCLTVCNLLGQRHGATLSKPVDCKHNGVIDPDHGDLCRCTGCSAPWKGPRCNVCPLTVETDCKAPTDKHYPYLDTATCQCKFSCLKEFQDECARKAAETGLNSDSSEGNSKSSGSSPSPSKFRPKVHPVTCQCSIECPLKPHQCQNTKRGFTAEVDSEKCVCKDVCKHTGQCDTAHHFHFVAEKCDCVEECPSGSGYVRSVDRYYARGTDIQAHFCGLTPDVSETTRMLILPANAPSCTEEQFEAPRTETDGSFTVCSTCGVPRRPVNASAAQLASMPTKCNAAAVVYNPETAGKSDKVNSADVTVQSNGLSPSRIYEARWYNHKSACARQTIDSNGQKRCAQSRMQWEIAHREKFNVGAEDCQDAITIEKATFGTGEAISVQVCGFTGQPKDRVAVTLASKGEQEFCPDCDWGNWLYTDGTQAGSGVGLGVTRASKTTVRLTPSRLAPGKYEIRLYNAGDYSRWFAKTEITIAKPTGNKLAIVNFPSGQRVVAGEIFDLKIETQDKSGNRLQQENSADVEVSLQNVPNLAAGELEPTLPLNASLEDAFIAGTVSKKVKKGDVSMTGLKVVRAGQYALVASPKQKGLYLPAFFEFTVLPAKASKCTFLKEPLGGPKVGADPMKVEVAVSDSFGNTVTTDSATKVALRLSENPAGNAMLSGGDERSVSNGVAQFSLNVDKAGQGYTLAARAETLAAGVSEPFDITCPVDGVKPCLPAGKQCDCMVDCCSQQCAKDDDGDAVKMCK